MATDLDRHKWIAMAETPYSEFDSDQLSLRDRLAIDRTVLANERTFLAYIRTALALIIVGASFLHFVEEGIVPALGTAFIVIGGVVQLFGVLRFLKTRRRLAAIELDSNRSASRR